MGLMSPTVIRITGFVLLSGTIAFIVAGFINQTEEQSTGSVLLTGVVVGGPLSAIVGVIAGILWEKLIGPIKSVEHLDMRKNRRKQQRQVAAAVGGLYRAPNDNRRRPAAAARSHDQ